MVDPPRQARDHFVFGEGDVIEPEDVGKDLPIAEAFPIQVERTQRLQDCDRLIPQPDDVVARVVGQETNPASTGR